MDQFHKSNDLGKSGSRGFSHQAPGEETTGARVPTVYRDKLTGKKVDITFGKAKASRRKEYGGVNHREAYGMGTWLGPKKR